jgi:hypothetical protein
VMLAALLFLRYVVTNCRTLRVRHPIRGGSIDRSSHFCRRFARYPSHCDRVRDVCADHSRPWWRVLEMTDLLPEHVTLVDLVANDRLSNPARYLRKAFANVLFAGDYGTVYLRIGRTGYGASPQYALEQGGRIINRYCGQVHKPWDDGSERHEERWSSVAMNAAELHSLWCGTAGLCKRAADDVSGLSPVSLSRLTARTSGIFASVP